MLPLQGALVLSLLGELRSYMTCSVAKKKKKKRERKKFLIIYKVTINTKRGTQIISSRMGVGKSHFLLV